jgi:Transglycosylase SLT domain
MALRMLQVACVIGVVTMVTLAYPVSQREPRLSYFGEFDGGKADRLAAAEDEDAAVEKVVATIDLRPTDDVSADDVSSDALLKSLSYLADSIYSEVPPDRRPSDVVLDALKDVPVGTPIEEIKHASEAFGLDFNFMKTVAKIESDFDPKQRTGSYVGLFQLSNFEFARYGAGDILDPRDNAIAAAYKFKTAAILFELETHKKATLGDLYLIHQQGTQGAEQHISHPDRLAWKSMCATEEGKEKGESWCKRAIWENTLPEIKRIWKSVDNLTSGAFVQMWQQRIEHFYTRYSEATPK